MTLTRELFQGYVEELDVTVVFEDIMNGEEEVSKEVRGHYEGKPNEETMQTYCRKNEAIVSDKKMRDIEFFESFSNKPNKQDMLDLCKLVLDGKLLDSEIFQVFSNELDMTIIFEKHLDGERVVSMEVKGFYYGSSDEEGMREYYGKMKVIYE